MTTAPELLVFEKNMVDYGVKNSEFLQDMANTFDQRLDATYYDGTWVFFQIAEYTGNFLWMKGVEAALKVYRDEYVLKWNGNIPGYYKFPHGLALSALHTSSLASREALISMARNGAFARPTDSLEATKPSTESREVAYLIMTALQAERLGEPLNARYKDWVEQSRGHVDQWFVLKTAPYVRPFMVSLTCQSQIEHAEKFPEDLPKVAALVKTCADGIWPLWLPDKGAFKYTDRDTLTGGVEPAPDLNLLIAPLFAWLYYQTGDSEYLKRADLIFTGGVRQAYLAKGKHFNQNYRWAFKYLEWRQGRGNPFEVPNPPGTLECTNYFLKQIRDKLYGQ